MIDETFETIPHYVISPYVYNEREGDLAIHSKITDYLYIPPWSGNIMDCHSDLDYYGYENMEWDVDYCVFYDYDENVKAIYAEVTKSMLPPKVVDKIGEYLLDFIHSYRYEGEPEDDYLISSIYERKD